MPSWRTRRRPPRRPPRLRLPGGPDTGGSDGAPKRASPFVRSLARKYGINLAQVSGSGLGGRVTKDDILAFIEQRGAQPVAEAPAPWPPPAPPAPAAPASATRTARAAAPMPPGGASRSAGPRPGGGGPGPDEELVPLTPMRRAIADHGQERPDGAARLGHDRDRRLAAGQARAACSRSGSAARASS